jgi:hypothetical protein
MPDSPAAPKANTWSPTTLGPPLPGSTPGLQVRGGSHSALLAITLLLGTAPATTTLLAVVALLFLVGLTRGMQAQRRPWPCVPGSAPDWPANRVGRPRPPRFAQLSGYW